MIFLGKIMLQLLLLLIIEVCISNRFQQLVSNLRIMQIFYFISSVFVIQRHRSLIINSPLKIIDRNIIAKGSARNRITGE